MVYTNGKKILLIVMTVCCILLTAVLAARAIGIYADGAARKAADPLADIFTAEEVARKLTHALPLIGNSVIVLVFCLALKVKDPDADRPAKAEGRITPPKEPEHVKIVQAVIVAAAVLLIIAGICNGSALDVLIKGINICTECIGLG